MGPPLQKINYLYEHILDKPLAQVAAVCGFPGAGFTSQRLATPQVFRHRGNIIGTCPSTSYPERLRLRYRAAPAAGKGRVTIP